MPIILSTNNYLKTLKYGTLHTYTNIDGFKIQIVTTIRQSEIKIHYFNIGFQNYCIKMPREPKKKGGGGRRGN